MNYNYMIKNGTPVREELLKFGFEEVESGIFQNTECLLNGLNIVVRISDKSLDVDVLDGILNVKYGPFYSGHGGAAIKSEVREHIEDILSRCYKFVHVRADFLEYLEKTYDTRAEYPWEQYPNYCVLRVSGGEKWFAAVMNVAPRSLGLSGEGEVDIVNLKLDPEKVQKLIDNVRFFPAYHMNKKCWISALLDKNADIDLLKRLADESYNLVVKK